MIGKNKEERNEVMKKRKTEGEIFLFKTLQRCSIAVNKIVFLTGSSNTSWSHSYVKSKKKKPNPEKQRTGWWLLDAGSGYGEIEWKQSKVTNF